MTPDPEPEGPAGRRSRALLSFFFLLHWGAVCAYLLPGTRAALEPLPEALRVPATLVFPRMVRAVWPVARPYLDLTATRQHWMMFAPDPADWTPSVEVVPHFEVEDGGWRADTLRLRGPREAGYPHFLDHRTFRVLFNLGYEDWGAWYRPWFAREMCRSIVNPAGGTPEGVALLARWDPIRPPWEEPGRAPYVQWMGGFDCPEQAEPRAPWRGYGLPYPVDPSGWPLLERRPQASAGAPAPKRGGRP